ncbi:MAG: hypothetical protein A3B07_01290 [Candidatus Yonathbacteria bacterium RIFCSPLOWO2_01_FULL_43_27]|uniref:Peptidoglycan binding-like domain-containing protein n=1 Tax=Candidatus Yonathbacteria bacterium RIFCSPLOWO2_01_FULL_43_27 TaxID=1802726 RepID=A0A1G2SCH1_9BACT|nr:MAG: hypothetical protein A3B07_01290 [Candidatus Yonathbacteria bacterium RIFCSPLOWO2_01_FULL_43_27]
MKYLLSGSVILLSIFFTTQTTFAEGGVFLRTLKMGMSGEDVRELQKFLNTDTETRVSLSGAGSLGNETNYFGPATHRALVLFQEKHRTEILSPLGLTQGTGVFGLKTRVFLLSKNERGVAQRVPYPQTTPTSSSVTPAQTTTPVSPVNTVTSVVLTNPNLKNLEYAITEVKKIGVNEGMSSADLVSVEQSLRDVAATSTDLTKKFLETVVTSKAQAQIDALNTKLSVRPDSFLGKALVRFGIAKIAHAAALVPFGGTVVFAAPCTCGPESWLVIINPLPPSYATALSYILGTQVFLTNITPSIIPPHIAQSFLGEYIPAVPSCRMVAGPGCVVVPTWGTISPLVGSSL